MSTNTSGTTKEENARLQALLRDGRATEVIQAIAQPKSGWKPDSYSYGLAMRACSNTGDYGQAAQLLERAESKHGIVPSEYMWGALLEACRRSHRLDQAMDVAKQMGRRGVSLNPFALASLMDTHGRAGDWQGALRLLEDHKPKLLTTTATADKRNLTIVYTTAISALGRGRQWRRALELFYSDMPRDGVPADVVTYGALMHACGRAKQWKEVNRLFQHLTHETALTPNLIVCNSVLKAYNWANDETQLPGALALLQSMEQGKYVYPTAETYHIVLQVLAKFKRTQETRALYDSLPAPSVKHASDVLLAYANAEDGEAALAFLAHLRKVGPVPDGLSFSHTILACGRAGLVEEARALLAEMRERGMLGRSRSVSVVENLSKEDAWEEAASLSAAITETFVSNPELTPGPMTFNTSLSVFCCVGDSSGGVSLLRHMDAHNVQVSEKNGAALLQTLAETGQWPIAMYLLEEWLLQKRRRIVSSGLAGLTNGLPHDVLTTFGPALYQLVHSTGAVSHQHQEEGVVDLHGFSTGQSVCAILATLKDMAMSDTKTAAMPSLVMVVGRGKNSRGRKGGVLGPYLIRALVNPTLFNPPLIATQDKHNPGRIVLGKTEVAKYIKAIRHKAVK